MQNLSVCNGDSKSNKSREVKFIIATSKNPHCVKSVQIRSYFWAAFSCIQTEYEELLRKSPYSVRRQENTDQK